jgi:hypothetical protein
MGVQIRRPATRTCDRCGRKEQWDDEAGAWQVSEEKVGDKFCIHDWDITGEFAPVER